MSGTWADVIRSRKARASVGGISSVFVAPGSSTKSATFVNVVPSAAASRSHVRGPAPAGDATCRAVALSGA